MQKGAIVYAATASVVTGVALAYAACADSNAPSANRRWEASLAKSGSESKVKSISVLPSTATVMAGSTVRLTATANPPGSAATLTWSSSNSAIATISPSGVVAGVAVGSASIRVSAGGKTGMATVNVLRPPL